MTSKRWHVEFDLECSPPADKFYVIDCVKDAFNVEDRVKNLAVQPKDGAAVEQAEDVLPPG